MSDVPKWARETVERFLEDRDWLEDCTCASIPEQTCWYHLAPEVQRRYREDALIAEVSAAYERGWRAGLEKAAGDIFGDEPDHPPLGGTDTRAIHRYGALAYAADLCRALAARGPGGEDG